MFAIFRSGLNGSVVLSQRPTPARSSGRTHPGSGNTHPLVPSALVMLLVINASVRSQETGSKVLLLLRSLGVGAADPLLPLLQGVLLLQALQTQSVGSTTQERVRQGESWNTRLRYGAPPMQRDSKRAFWTHWAVSAVSAVGLSDRTCYQDGQEPSTGSNIAEEMWRFRCNPRENYTFN